MNTYVRPSISSQKAEFVCHITCSCVDIASLLLYRCFSKSWYSSMPPHSASLTTTNSTIDPREAIRGPRPWIQESAVTQRYQFMRTVVVVRRDASAESPIEAALGTRYSPVSLWSIVITRTE